MQPASFSRQEVISQSAPTAPQPPSLASAPPPKDRPQREARLFGETLIRLNSVPSLLPGRNDGRKVGLASVYRWIGKGVRGVRLEYIRAPFGRVTSVEAVERFLSRLSEGRGISPALTPARRQREIARATAYVEETLGLHKGVAAKGDAA